VTAEKASLIKEISAEIRSFAKLNFGTQNGPDFAELAKMLIEMDDFTTRLFVSTALCMISSSQILGKMEGNPDKSPASLRSAFRGSSLEMTFLEIFYWGYLSGKRIAEIETLTKLAEKI
jgi:hypothetical protein